MVELKRGEAKFVLGCVQALLDAFEREVAAVLRRELQGIEPARVAETRQELTLLLRQIESRRVHDAFLPLVRRALLDGRKVAAVAIEAPLAKVIEPRVAESLRRGLLSYEEFLKAPWLGTEVRLVSFRAMKEPAHLALTPSARFLRTRKTVSCCSRRGRSCRRATGGQYRVTGMNRKVGRSEGLTRKSFWPSYLPVQHSIAPRRRCTRY